MYGVHISASSSVLSPQVFKWKWPKLTAPTFGRDLLRGMPPFHIEAGSHIVLYTLCKLTFLYALICTRGTGVLLKLHLSGTPLEYNNSTHPVNCPSNYLDSCYWLGP